MDYMNSGMMERQVRILDACCGSRMFWFDKNEPHTTYIDIRSEVLTLCDGRQTVVSPDIVMDCRHTSFDDDYFDLIVFDPPHRSDLGENSWMCHKYGKLSPTDWQSFLKDSMDELMRILRIGGTLIFKWNEKQIKTSEVLAAVYPHKPLFGQTTRNDGTTIWMTFVRFS